MDWQENFAVFSARLAKKVSRLANVGSGTSLPGAIALRIDKRIIKKVISRQIASPVIIVTGTNGKTTTANLINFILSQANWKIIHNTAGANLASGVATVLTTNSKNYLPSEGAAAIFEVDEATLPKLINDLNPRVVVVTNLFRDQLDRYGELDTLAIQLKKSLASLKQSSTLVLNADDPRVAYLGSEFKGKILYYGVDDLRWQNKQPKGSLDSGSCLLCNKTLNYDGYYFAHLGNYSCNNCYFKQPQKDITATDIRLGLTKLSAKINLSQQSFQIETHFSGFYNIYNILASISACSVLKIKKEHICRGLSKAKPAFGRLEEIKIRNRHLTLMLVKNPTGFDQIIQLLKLDNQLKNLLIGINDNLADGTDISWLWDVQVETLPPSNLIVTSGTRAADMAIRLKYSQADSCNIVVLPPLAKAINYILDSTSAHEKIYLLLTYTAMLETRKYLSTLTNVDPGLKKTN
jgi:UDP-N-acetylmuramyl tripeptide synthase